MNAPFDLNSSFAADAASPGTPLVIANISRRKFLQGASALGGLVLAVGFPASLRAADPPKYGADGMPHGWVDNPLVFVAIGEDGIIRIVCHRSFLTRRLFDRGADAVVGAAAADVAGHGRLNVGVSGLGLLLKERGCRHDLARLAVSALRNTQVDPRRLHRLADLVRADRFDGDDLLVGER